MVSSVNFGFKFEVIVDEFVKNGCYGLCSEVLCEGVWMVEEREVVIVCFELEIMKGIEDVEVGCDEDIDVVFGCLICKYEDMLVKKVV